MIARLITCARHGSRCWSALNVDIPRLVRIDSTLSQVVSLFPVLSAVMQNSWQRVIGINDYIR